MREIKFRAWNGEEMIYGNEDKYDGWMIDMNSPTQICRWDGPCKEIKDLMQYTGLKDKNGKEIYEGDIVKWKDLNLRVGFYNAHFMIYDNLAKRGGTFHEDLWKALFKDNLEVIGNIYENPQLAS